MGLFGGHKRVDPENVHVEQEKSGDESGPAQVQVAGNAQVSIELTKINAQIDSFKEIRKATSEQINQIREQLGELRGMIVNTDKSMSTLEVKTTKAVDLVDSVQPDKMMISLQKQDGKIEALKANIDSNETMLKTVMAEIKGVRLKMGLFKGVEQLTKLSNETKDQIMNVQKINATIERHADKVESIYTEFQKSFADFRQLTDEYKQLSKQFKDLQQAFDQVKVKIDGAAQKKEMEGVITKFNDFEKKVAGLIELLDKHANDLPIKLEDKFKQWEDRIEKRFERTKKIFESINSFEKNFPKVSEQLKMPPPSAEKPIAPIPDEIPKLNADAKAEDKKGAINLKIPGLGLFKKKEKA